MKKTIFCFLFVFLLSGCKPRQTTFSGVISQVFETYLVVTVSDNPSFEEAIVYFSENLTLSFTPEIGQEITVKGSSPSMEGNIASLTADAITLKEKEGSKVSYKKISPDEAKTIMKSNPNVIILDVRTEEEYAEGHIPNSILLPDFEISQRAASVLPDRSAAILIYCRSGRRSEASVHLLISMGYTNVTDFGGILDWTGEIVK